MRWLLILFLAVPAFAADRPAFNPKLGTVLDTSARLTAADGRTATLGDWLDGKPALVIFGYDNCPNLCGLTQSLVAGALKDVSLDPADYRVLFISIAEVEGPEDATNARKALDEAVPGSLGPWRFLTGPAGAKLAHQAGLDFDQQVRTGDYAHPITVMTMTSGAKLSAVLPAMSFHAKDLELSLVDASNGKLGSLAQNLYLLCAHYDATQGQYTLAITNWLQIAGLLTLALMAFGVWRLARKGSG